MGEELLDTRQVADRMGVDESTVRRWCENQRVPGAQRISDRWVIPAGALALIQRKPRGRPQRRAPDQ